MLGAPIVLPPRYAFRLPKVNPTFNVTFKIPNLHRGQKIQTNFHTSDFYSFLLKQIK